MWLLVCYLCPELKMTVCAIAPQCIVGDLVGSVADDSVPLSALEVYNQRDHYLW